jgi:hypothetical protein
MQIADIAFSQRIPKSIISKFPQNFLKSLFVPFSKGGSFLGLMTFYKGASSNGGGDTGQRTKGWGAPLSTR